MPVFRIDVHRKSGKVLLWMKTPFGFQPIMGWADVEGVKEFAEMLLEFYDSREQGKDRVKEISDKLLWQALGDTEYFERT